jgi:stage II sporulation protein D
MADYLWRVLAAEMPASFHPDALCAQAVCARTYTLCKGASGRHPGADVCTSSACCQAYRSPDEAAARWGESAAAFGEKIAAAVAATDGVTACYDGAPIQALFFSSSTALTETAAAVWGSHLPYLVSVSSPEGEGVPNYISTVTLSADALRQRVLALHPQADLSGPPEGWFTGIAHTDSGRVATLTVGGIPLSGGEARTLFALRSTCFTLTYGPEGFTFTVTGYGHGVGLSQYGANAMAEAGVGWPDILRHYYTGITLEAGW